MGKKGLKWVIYDGFTGVSMGSCILERVRVG